MYSVSSNLSIPSPLEAPPRSKLSSTNHPRAAPTPYSQHKSTKAEPIDGTTTPL
jgi:hypothetical protein